jgi:uncharacterized lipoprotein YmbA
MHLLIMKKHHKENEMKKLFVIGLVAILCACASKPATNVAGLDLDTAISQAATQMERRIPAGTMVALVSVASPSTAFSTQVLTRLESAIVGNGNLVVVDRANLDKVREEQGFQLSGEVDDESAKSIGKLLGAGAIVTGTLADLGDVYSLTLKAINIETATVAVSYLADLAKTTRIETLLATRDGAGSGAIATASTSRPSTATQAPASVTPPTPAYRIGDTGSGGGIIFYDKGNRSGGWQYMEVSRNDLGKAPMMKVDGTKTEVGTGIQNTQLISKSGGMAAMLCEAYRGGGFTDWFLPSKDELNLMYINLVRISQIVDWADIHWSSSEVIGVGLWDAVWAQNFSDGNQEGGLIHNASRNYTIRAVRRF